MKRFILILLFVFVLIGQCFAATVYVKKIDGAVYYESGASSCDDVTDADSSGDIEAALSASGSGGYCYICAGIYSGTDIDSADLLDTTATNQQIEGVGSVILDGSTVDDHLLVIAHATTTVKNITFRGSYSARLAVNVTGNSNIEDCIFKGNYKHLGANGYTLNLEKNVFEGQTESAQDVQIKDYTNSKTINIVGNIFRPGDDDTGGDTSYLMGPRLMLENAATYNIYHNVFAGSSADAINSAANVTGTVNIENNTFLSGGGNSGRIITLQSGATTVVSNNYITIGVVTPGVPYNNADTAENNVISDAPLYKSASRKGYVVFGFDDYNATYSSWSYLYGTDGTDGVLAEFIDRGMSPCWFIDTYSALGQANYSDNIQWAYNQGVEIGLHTRTHTRMDITDGIDLTTTGSNATVDVDRGSHKIVFYSDEGGTENIPASGNFEDTQIATLVSEIDALTYFGASKADTGLSDYALGEVLADTSGAQSIGAGYTCLIDRTTGSEPATGIFKTELLDSLNWLEAIVGAGTVKSFAYPGGDTDATAQEALRLLKSGQVTSARVTDFVGATGSHISNLNRYAIDCFNYTDVKTDSTDGDSTEDIKANINSLMAYLAEVGGVAHIYAHQTSELSKAQWSTILDEVVKWGRLVTNNLSPSEAMTEIMASATDDGDGTLSRTWTDGSNYKLRSTSPLIDAGSWVTDVNDDGSADINGEYVYRLPNIGADQSGGQPKDGNSTISIGGGGIGIW